MAGNIDWTFVASMSLDGLESYLDAWTDVVDGIDDSAEDLATANSRLAAAFDGCGASALYSPGAEAALAQGSGLSDRMSDARTEAVAVKEVVDYALGELKRLKNEFTDAVDRINGTAGEYGTGTYQVSLALGEVRAPAIPEDLRNAPGGREYWADAHDGRAAAFTAELDDLVGQIADIDADTAAWLANNSSNLADFNPAPDEETPSVRASEDAARQAAELLTGGEDGVVDDAEIAAANEILAEHTDDPVFATALLTDLGPQGLLDTTSDIALTIGEDGKPVCGDGTVDAMYRHMGDILATGTDPDNEPHVSPEWIEGLMAAGRTEQTEHGVDAVEYQLYGYQELAPILAHGTYDPDFIVPITEHMITLDAQLSNDLAEWPDPHAQTGLWPPNFDRDLAANPVNAGLLACDHNPQAATELFSHTGSDPTSYPDFDGNPARVPDPLEYIMSTACSADHRPELPYDIIDADIAGGAIEAACTGVRSSTDPSTVDVWPHHTSAMVAVTERVMDLVAADPSKFEGPDSVRGAMVDNFADIVGNYAVDIYRAYASENEVSAEWFPQPHGELLDLGNFSRPESPGPGLTQFLQVIGHDPSSMARVMGSMEAVMAEALPFALDGEESIGTATQPCGRVVAELTHGYFEGIRDENTFDVPKDFGADGLSLVKEGTKYVAGKTIGSIPLVGDELGFLSGYVIDALFGGPEGRIQQETLIDQAEFGRQVSQQLAEIDDAWVYEALARAGVPEDDWDGAASIVVDQLMDGFWGRPLDWPRDGDGNLVTGDED